ncbi:MULTISPECIES: hypothetical protein [Klebsiella pneumoniae complex]|uniref:hypothetical protein n=1 Tax=Klebsiella pneumoniae complex TaxID=3390273 RepID=UPI0010F91666|nr:MULTISPECIES: hypothetical protein [Klebsiella]HCB1571937.1 hypothetical protein [Klebsiella quasipneumoniae]EKZ5956870.1 hypothetical protein [Klebsiella pneumoniae]MCM6274668.1 hypothetical protein [Klebsiella pneumoniae]MDE9345282.1 hypothetical protein [Klebsiella variicola]HBU0011352.1 hypothetical protein [Klebsiella pneumoniae]
MSYSDIVATIAMIVSITAVPASGYFSYHFAIKGEKRKEFNVISDVIRQKLREQLRLIENGVFPGGGNVSISQREIDTFIDISSTKNKKHLSELWSEYQRSLQNSIDASDPLKDPVFHSPSIIQSAIEKILPYCQRQ